MNFPSPVIWGVTGTVGVQLESIIGWIHFSAPPNLLPMFHFTISEMNFLMTIFAMAIGWSLDHRRLAAENNKMLASLEIFLLLDPSDRPTIEEIKRAGEEARRGGN